MFTLASRHSLTVYALLASSLTACTSWRVQIGWSPRELVSTEHPKVVRLTHADGSQVILHHPRLGAGESLAGVVDGAPSSVAVADVTQVAVREFSPGKTFPLVAATVALVAWIYAHTGCRPENSCIDEL